MKCEKKSWKNGTTFIDLNLDCQLLILEQLNFKTLINMAEVNEPFAILAAGVFKRKFTDKTIEMQSLSLNDGGIGINENKNYIYIGNLNKAQQVFKYFGHYISKLTIAYGKNQENSLRKLFPLVLRYSDALTEFTINTRDETILDGITRPFHNVENLSISGNYKKLGSNTLNLKEMFPKMHRLRIEYIEVDDQTFLDLEYPNLEHLSFKFVNDGRLTEISIGKFIKKNPQIRSVQFAIVSMRFLKTLSETLPNLEHLQVFLVGHTEHAVDHVRFPNVKHLKLESTRGSFPSSLTFDQLQHFEFSNDNPDEWLPIIERNLNLSKLTIAESVFKTELLQLAGMRLPYLTEVQMICGSDVESDDIATFLQVSDALKMLKLECYFGKSLDELRNEFTSGWHIEQSHSINFLFQRKVDA